MHTPPHLLALRYIGSCCLLIITLSSATAQRGCDDNPLTFGTAGSGCLVCPPVSSIVGSTMGYTSTEFKNNEWCGTIENDQFFVAFADQTGRISFNLTTDPSCLAPIQYAVYQGEGLLNQIECSEHRVFPGETKGYFKNGLVPGERILIRIDGFGGDICGFLLTFFQRGAGGYNTYQSSYPTGSNATVLKYAEVSCLTCTYDPSYVVEPAGSATLTAQQLPAASPPHRELIAQWGAAAATRATIEETTVLSGTGNDAVCAPSARRELLSHFLDQSYVYLEQDTVFDCSGDRHTLLLAAGARRRILFLEGAAQRYVVGGAGPAGTFLQYSFRQNNVVLRSGSLTTSRFTDTVRVDPKFGATVLTVTNPNNYPTEVLIQRSAGAGLPYRFVQDCQNTSYQVCGGQPVFEFNCGVRNPLATTDWDDDCGGIIELQDARLSSATGGDGVRVPVQGRLNGWSVSWRLQFDRFAPPTPGNYIVRGRAIIPQGCAALGCVSPDPVEFEIPLTISAPADTIRLPDVELPSGGGAAVLFRGITGLETLSVDRAGEYVQAANCVLYLQRAVAAPAVVNLGEQLICPGNCLTAPTGQTFGCVPGTASLRASNDTIYVANVRYDATEPLILRSADYRCDSLTGEWTAQIRWTGSRGPWYVDGVQVLEPSALIGPTREPLLSVRVVGTSPCVDTVTFRAATTCRPSSLTELARQYGIELVSNPSAELEIRIAAGRWEMRMVDVLGRTVLSGFAEAGTQRLSASTALPAGSYFIDFRQNELRASLHWVKE